MEERVVAVAFGVDDEGGSAVRDVLEDHADVVFLKPLSEAERDEVLQGAEVMVSSALPIGLGPDLFGKAPALRFVQLLWAGVDGLDFSAVPSSVLVASNVGAFAEPMAEHVMAMTLALAKRLPQHHAEMAAGKFDQYSFSLTLDGAVCAIVGFGGIGKATARLMRPFGARIWAINTSGATDEEGVELVGTLDDLDRVLQGADVVVLSIPLNRATRGLIGARELDLMKPKAILVNVARGPIVEEKALYDHLVANPDFCAGIDTWWREPLRSGSFGIDYPLFDLPNLIGSPHNSGIVAGILSVAARRAAENVLRYLQGEAPHGVVRREDY